MCGFAGFIDFQNNQQHKKTETLQILRQMGEQLSRRGPDDEVLFNSSPFSFIFKRLSIIDVAGGQQPIWNEDKTMFVAVNGEIYNHLELRSKLQEKHQFSTNSDAEIVLHLYEEIGAKALHYLNGMFAIALWDGQRQQLFLARDRLGIKPLYYTQVGSLLIFGSTLTSLLAHPNAPRHPQFQDLTNLSVTTSYVRRVNRLAGGHYLLYDANTTNLTPQCYWNLENYLVTEPYSDSRQPEDYIHEYRDLFADSVKKRLMSDVPLGAFLSGGLDSGAIVAAATQSYNKDLHCFSILADYTREMGDIQEARQFCERFNLPFHPVYFDTEKLLDEIDFSLETFEYFIWMIDAPKFSFEWFFKHELHRYAKTLFPDLKVMLLGQGADEFAGGYSAPEDSSTPDWQNYIQQLAQEEEQKKQAKQLTSLKDGSYLFDRVLKSYPPGCTQFQKSMLMEVFYLQDYNLWHEDRSSMSQSMEARVPFLDHRLVEYLAAIPPQHHPTLFWNKKIIREMSMQWLPHDFVYRKKSNSAPHEKGNQIHSRIVQKIFPQFCEKYVGNSQSLFSENKIRGWFDQANGSGVNAIEAVDQLLYAMAMTVFKNLCHTGKPPTPIDYLYGRSPLKTLHNF